MRRRHGAGVGAGERSRCGLDKRISGVAQSVELLSFPQPASMHLLVSTPLVSTGASEYSTHEYGALVTYEYNGPSDHRVAMSAGYL